jgi:hypothetical protein
VSLVNATSYQSVAASLFIPLLDQAYDMLSRMARGTQGKPDLSWLWRRALIEEGPHTAAYPYFGLREILSLEDCRPAVFDETQALEAEFGRALVEPLYRLIWALNTGKDSCTSHTAISPPDHKSPFAWAGHYLGSELITLPRLQSERHDVAVANEMVETLGRILAASPLLERQNTKGWRVIVRPTNVSAVYEVLAAAPGGGHRTLVREHRAYGCGLIVSGSASSRVKACERWSRCVAFVAETLHHLQTMDGAVPALPHRHFDN